eukprot:m.26859 g.26859  ORF g.26859 m.26859 type:complete len:241 (+) comp7840_c0_seq1:149-871(+)
MRRLAYSVVNRWQACTKCKPIPQQVSMFNINSFGSTVRRFSQRHSQDKKTLTMMYNEALETRPVITKAIMTAVIVGSGDVICQVAIEGHTSLEKFDWGRLGRMMIIGATLIGPTLHTWYGFLYQKLPGSGLAISVKRVLLDQFTFAPVFPVIFFTALFALENKLGVLKDHLKNNYVDIVKTNWFLWIPAQLINFTFIPPQHAVMFANFVALFWNAYLSWIGHKNDNAEKSEPIVQSHDSK